MVRPCLGFDMLEAKNERRSFAQAQNVRDDFGDGGPLHQRRQNNPAISPSDFANVRKVMESLMERKLELFPDDNRQIVSAKIVMVGKDYRIEVASATL